MLTQNPDVKSNYRNITVKLYDSTGQMKLKYDYERGIVADILPKEGKIQWKKTDESTKAIKEFLY